MLKRSFSSLRVPLTSETYALHRDQQFKRLGSEDLKIFESIIGKDHVLRHGHDIESYNIDWTRKYRGQSTCVLRPKTPLEISRILAYCNQHSIAVVPQGGNTGLVGGSVPVFDEIILSTSRLNAITHFDEFSGILTCQAGCVLETLDNYLTERGYMMPLDLGSKGTCQIGGNLGSNAGGLRLVRYGSLHGTVLSMEVVLPSGKIVELGKPLRKDNTGYDLKQLFIGSEGTLGIITGVSILTPPRPKSIQVAMVGIESFDKVLRTFKSTKEHLGEILSAFEVFDRTSLDLVLKHSAGTRNPFESDTPFYVLIETAGSNKDHDDEKMSVFLESLMDTSVVVDGALAQDESQLAAFWRIRENISDSCAAEGGNYKYDISVPVDAFYPLVEDVKTFLASKGLYDPFNPDTKTVRHVVGFGHMGDGNVHLNVMTNARSREFEDLLSDFVFKKTQERQGSISAEHGVGLQKAQHLGYSKSEDAIQMMRLIKSKFDPKGILNPYKLIPRKDF